MELLYKYARIVPFCPFVASGLVGLGLFLFPKATKSLRRACAIPSISSLSVAMFISFNLFWQQIVGHPTYQYSWSWILNNDISSEAGFLVDPLTSIMLILVTTVGIPVMIYSDSYMCHDQGYVRFPVYLSLSTASMLGLVLSPNLIQIYVFRELVGMCSYLLIGFWFTRPSAANACQKAFVTNRIGDSGLLLGISGIYWITGSFEIHELSERFHELIGNGSISPFFANTCALLLLLGPVAKSAQIPLHVWLPDAMEGPTPISALIHAATMVAAGIFLVARMFDFFEAPPFTMNVIPRVGGATALLGATLALAQKDLKKGLAHSTMSQLGYTMLALGIGSYRAASFHLITHAYSKALLFPGSGSVIHSMETIVGYSPDKSQNMILMGGLRKYMPITGTTFLSGTLSLCGIPPFACFWSKDEIIVDSWLRSPFLGWIASFTAGLTAFYMFRIYFITLEGSFRASNTSSYSSDSFTSNTIWGDNQEELIHQKIGLISPSVRDEAISEGSLKKTHISDEGTPVDCSPTYYSRKEEFLYPKESDILMLLPLILLAIPTLFIGFVGVPSPQTETGLDYSSDWLAPLTNPSNGNSEGWLEFLTNSIPSVTISLVGILISFILYGPLAISSREPKKDIDPVAKKGSLGSFSSLIQDWSYNRGYIDNYYDMIFVKGIRLLSNYIYLFDRWIIDGIVNGIGISSLFGGEGAKYGEGGRVSSYSFGSMIGIIPLLTVIIPIHKNDILYTRIL
uniref:NADH dehydrogenase subunit 5 n=1 Tax=Todea barbara TaxID=90702 RepID=UPI0023D87AF7|nr:NADH dehydrogenase subunit 5 [Todea barbara]WDE24579.1 NADH dehydrogenase subunit 5 [Todea barbara]